MRWWLRVHRLPFVVVSAVVLTLLSVESGSLSLLFPALGGTTPLASIPVAAVLPLVLAIITTTCLDQASAPAAVRRTDLLDLGAIAIVLVLVVAVSGIALSAGAESSAALATVRNTGTFLGLALVAREWLGARHQSVPGVVYLFLAALFGRGAPGRPAAWASVVTTSIEPEYWVFGLVVVLAAAVVSVRRVTGRL
jgi:hypothetical protein